MLKNNLADLEKQKMHMAYDPVIPFLAVDSRSVNRDSTRDSVAPQETFGRQNRRMRLASNG